MKDIDFDLKSLENDVQMPVDMIADYKAEDENPIPILYHSAIFRFINF